MFSHNLALFGVLLSVVCRTLNGLPDIALDYLDLADSMFFDQKTFSPGHCAIEECGVGVGVRDLLRFPTKIVNIGLHSLELAERTNANTCPPITDESECTYEFHVCHNHYHLLNFASYSVYAAADTDFITDLTQSTGKVSFCLLDSFGCAPDYLLESKVPAVVCNQNTANHTCGTNQGINVGLMDTYGAHLDCQWVDITDFGNGDYVLVVIINPHGYANNGTDLYLPFYESDYTNNRHEFPFTITDQPIAAPTNNPTPAPTNAPSQSTLAPSEVPTKSPIQTLEPSDVPTKAPSQSTPAPSDLPTPGCAAVNDPCVTKSDCCPGLKCKKHPRRCE